MTALHPSASPNLTNFPFGRAERPFSISTTRNDYDTLPTVANRNDMQ